MACWIRWGCLFVVLAALVPAVAQDAAPEGGEPVSAVGEAETVVDEAAADGVAADGAATPVVAEDRVTTGEAFLLKLRQGGWTIAFLLALSVFGVAFAVERFVHLRRGVIVPRGLAEEADRLWRGGDRQALLSRVRDDDSTLARMIEIIVEHRRGGPEHVSNLAGDVATRELKRHLQRAYPLAVVSTVAPLLGLLGTVIGMIGAFDKVAAAGSLGDASVLGGDISKALITTGAGLAVAIPALILYHYFKARTSVFGIMLEEEATGLIIDWFGDSYAARARPEVRGEGAGGAEVGVGAEGTEEGAAARGDRPVNSAGAVAPGAGAKEGGRAD